MVQAARIDKATTDAVQPRDWDEAKHGRVGSIAIRYEIIDGFQFMRSAWDFEAIEALKIMAGAKMILGISAPRHPVVLLEVASLPVDFAPVYSIRRLSSPGGVPLARVDCLLADQGRARLIYCEEALGPEGLALAAGRAIDKIEELIRQEGLGA